MKVNSIKRQPLGQTMVEMAFALPIFLLLVMGIFEFGRLVFMNNAVYSASREGARYAAATDTTTSGTPRYIDCAAIRNATKKAGLLANLTDADITIMYDSGPSSLAGSKGSCPNPNPSLKLGDRIMVTVRATFHPSVSFGVFHDLTLTSTTSRTIIKDLDVNVDGTF